MSGFSVGFHTIRAVEAIYLVLLVLTRLAGLRSFPKLSSFDFAITVAMGSLLAATILTKNPPLVQGIMGLVVLFGIQHVISKLRRHTGFMAKVVDNEPLLLMARSKVIHENLDRARMTEADLKSKLRMAGVAHLLLPPSFSLSQQPMASDTLRQHL